MKYRFLSCNKSFLVGLLLLSLPGWSQLTDVQKLAQLNALLQSNPRSKSQGIDFITPYVLDSLFSGYQKTLSGSQVEAGKIVGTSVSVTDKGATANIGIRSWGSLFPSLNISGQGKENFINLFDKGQYGNTLSGGLKFNYFFKGSGFFLPSAVNLLHNQLFYLRTTNGTYEPTTGQTVTTAYDTRLTYIFQQINALQTGAAVYQSVETNYAQNLSTQQRLQVENFSKAADTLSKLGLLSKGFLEKTSTERNTEIASLLNRWTSATLGSGPIDLRLHYYLEDAEALQMKANWNALHFRWITFGVNYNVTPYKVLDSFNRDAKYSKTDNDYFFSATFSANFLSARPKGGQRRFYVSPTLSFKGARLYKEDNKITLERNLPYVINGDSLVRKDLTSELYKGIGDRKLTLGLEIPFIWYWAKSNIGFEIAPKGGWNDPKEDNIGLRVGLFIPAGIKEGVPVLVEPLFRLQKLFNGGNTNFWKDHFVVGFNVSVSLPTGITKIAK